MKKATQFLVATMLAGSLAACSVSPEERLERAQQAFATGDFAAAKIDLTAYLKEKTNDGEALRLLARTQLELGDGEGATNSLERLKSLGNWSDEDTILMAEAALLSGHPNKVAELVAGLDSAEAARVTALAHLANDDSQAAYDAFDKGLGANGPKARLRAEFARFYLSYGDLGAARSMIEAAKGEDPSQVDVQIADAQISAAQGRPKAALKAFDKVLKSHPANRVALLGRVAALGDMARLDDAQAQLDAMSMQPGDIDFAFLSAKIASERGEWDKVREVLQPLETQIQQKPQVAMLYGLALTKSGQPEQARSYLAPLIRKFPQSRSLRVSVAEAEFAANDARSAFDTMQPVADRPDASREELALMGKIAQKAGDPSAAKYRSRAKIPEGERFASLLTKGDKALRDKNWTVAVDAYLTIMGITDGKNALVLNNLGYALGQTGQAEQGLAHARRALQIEPNSPAIMDTVAALMLESGKDRQEAVNLLRKASRMDPANRRIAARLKAAESS